MIGLRMAVVLMVLGTIADLLWEINSFAPETGPQLSADHQLRVQNLDRNQAVESRVARDHLAHAACAQQRLDFVWAQIGSPRLATWEGIITS